MAFFFAVKEKKKRRLFFFDIAVFPLVRVLYVYAWVDKGLAIKRTGKKLRKAKKK